MQAVRITTDQLIASCHKAPLDRFILFVCARGENANEQQGKEQPLGHIEGEENGVVLKFSAEPMPIPPQARILRDTQGSLPDAPGRARR
jgi:hypothetical protein